jgi:TetR/AcrR family transcriptional regulator
LPRPAYSARTIDRPESILNAALAIFSEKGFDGARTRDIAARADVTLGLVQYHYGSKEKLWKEAVERAFGDLEGRIADLVLDPSEDSAVDVRERLRRLLLAHVSFVAEQPDFIRIMHDEGKRRGPRMRWLVDSYVKPFHERITPLIVQAQEQGVLPSGIAPTHFIYVMIGAVGMFFHQAEECKRVSGIDPADPAAIDAHTRALEAMFLGTAGMEIE